MPFLYTNIPLIHSHNTSSWAYVERQFYAYQAVPFVKSDIFLSQPLTKLSMVGQRLPRVDLKFSITLHCIISVFSFSHI